jgi:hypothetical protein
MKRRNGELEYRQAERCDFGQERPAALETPHEDFVFSPIEMQKSLDKLPLGPSVDKTVRE